MKKNTPKDKKMLKGPFRALLSWKNFSLCFLLLCTFGSAIAVVLSKHMNRSLHMELQSLQKQRDTLQVEWSRLLLEQGTLGSDVRVEQVAKDELEMMLPKQDEM